MKVLMVGANGKFAGMVLPELTRRGVVVRALLRNQKDTQSVKEGGAEEVAIGDLNEPKSLKSALDGVDGVFHIGPAFAPNEAEMGVAMVEAANAAGVRKFVFSGVIHPTHTSLPNHAAKIRVEEALYTSGMDYTVLQPAMFMQNLQGSWKQAVETGQFALPFSRHARTCYVDYRDVAECAGMAFTDDRLSNGTFELSSCGMVTRVEIAAIMSEVLGELITAAEVPFEKWADAARIPPGPVREGLERMYAEYDRYGFSGGNALVLQAILGHQPRPLRRYIQELAQETGKTSAAA